MGHGAGSGFTEQDLVMLIRNLGFILSVMRKALEVFEQGNKNESREAFIVIQEKENSDLDYGGSISDKWLNFRYILKRNLWQDWLINMEIEF